MISQPVSLAPKPHADVSALTFEKALAELETIVAKLERGDVPLEESIAAYERGEPPLLDPQPTAATIDAGACRSDPLGALGRSDEALVCTAPIKQRTVVGRTIARGPGVEVADVTDPDALRAAIARAEFAQGPISILVNNAGSAESAPFARTDAAMWGRMLAVNLTAVYTACHACCRR
eukprot:gene33335-44620_t